MTGGSVTLSSGRTLSYTAEAGVIAVGGSDASNAPIGGEADATDGHALARMSYVAYRARGGEARPVLFLWDGGPGASTGGLLVTSFGPVRVALPQPGDMVPPSAAPTIADNPDTLLDVADLVFVDAPGTGFGVIEGRDAAHRFYGIDGDAAAFARFIERFLVLHGRIGAPVFLFGHSYGTFRAPVVARLLAEDDMAPRGIVSVSQWLSFDDFLDAAPANPGTDNAFIDALPSYAAIGWYHHRLRDRPPALAPFLSQVEAFALHNYAAALLAGADLPPARAHDTAASLERCTGIPSATWLEADLRIDGAAFRRLVLGDPGRVVGRLDARYVGAFADPLASRSDGDPFAIATGPTITAAVARYERDVLGFGRTVGYSPDAEVPDLRWDEYHSTDGKPWDSVANVMPDLAKTMVDAPNMRFLMMNGFYDLSTTFLGAVEELRHLAIPAAQRRNIDQSFYETGHEPYVQDDVRRAMHDRIARFIRP